MACAIVLGLCSCNFSALYDLAGGRLISIAIGGDTAVAIGDTVRLRATGSVDGLIGLLSYDPLRDAKWTSWNSSVAVVMRPPPSPDDTLFSSVLVKGVRPGVVTIEASARGVHGDHVVVVVRNLRPPVRVGAARR